MAVTDISSNFQSPLQQLQLQQVRVSIEQNRQSARSLQAQAISAQAAADAAENQAISLSNAAAKAQSAANQASLQLQTTNSLSQIGTQVNNVLDQVVQRQAAAPPAATAPEQVPAAVQAPAAVVNTQGQTIGTVVNTTA